MKSPRPGPRQTDDPLIVGRLPRRFAATLLAALVLTGCSSGSPTSSAVRSSSPAVANSGPAWCDETATLILDDPSGTQVVLPNVWESSYLGITYVLHQVGDCIWMMGYATTEDPNATFATEFVGRLGSDFRIVGEFSDLNGQAVVGWDHGSVAYQIEFTDTGIVLVEDRSAEQPPGCTDSSLGSCPDPRTLTPRPE